MSLPRSVTAVIAALGLSACLASGFQDSPSTSQTLTGASVQAQPMCQAGCVDVDPNPEESGIYAGSAVTASSCTDGEQNDLDLDGLSDYCEKVLAEDFAPVMKYDANDDVRRQSYWAARPYSVGQVRILYAIGYYFDLGVATSAYASCVAASIGGFLGDCNGHNGDAEWVSLDVEYDTTTQHWNLVAVHLSKHKTVIGVAGTPYATGIEYPYHAGGAPRVYVALKKHANYPSRSECNAGTGIPDPWSYFFPFDTCQGNGAEFTIDALGSHNLGSDSVRFLDCVTSNDPFQQGNPAPATECFWSNQYFLGWNSVVQGTPPTGYGDILRGHGFQ